MSTIQTLIFDKAYYSRSAARNFAIDHGFKVTKIDEKQNSYRIRQIDPSKFSHFITKKLRNTQGVSLVIGFY